MDPTKVNSTDDILMAADARLNAPPDPKPDAPPPAGPDDAGEASPDAPGPDDAGEAAPDAPEAPAAEPSEALTADEVRTLRAEVKRAKDAELSRLAAEYLLDHPEEYEKARRARAGQRDQAPAAPAAEREQQGVNPLDNPQGWKYERYNQYVDYLASQGKTASPAAIQQQVEIDHVHARTERMHQDMLEERTARAREKEEAGRAQAQWRQEQEASAIAKQLRPLFKLYPNAATVEGQKDVEAHIIRAIHLGEPVNYEAIVKRVHGASQAAVKTWATQKRTMAAGTTAAAGRGASAQGARAKLVDRLPADVSSISEYAERAARGEQ